MSSYYYGGTSASATHYSYGDYSQDPLIICDHAEGCEHHSCDWITPKRDSRVGSRGECPRTDQYVELILYNENAKRGVDPNKAFKARKRK